MMEYLNPDIAKAIGGILTAVGSSLIMVKRWTASVDGSITALQGRAGSSESAVADLSTRLGNLALTQAQLAEKQMQMRTDHAGELAALDSKMTRLHGRLDEFQRDVQANVNTLTGQLGEVSGKLSVLIDKK